MMANLYVEILTPHYGLSGWSRFQPSASGLGALWRRSRRHASEVGAGNGAHGAHLRKTRGRGESEPDGPETRRRGERDWPDVGARGLRKGVWRKSLEGMWEPVKRQASNWPPLPSPLLQKGRRGRRGLGEAPTAINMALRWSLLVGETEEAEGRRCHFAGSGLFLEEVAGVGEVEDA
jgi:hypothetical protein